MKHLLPLIVVLAISYSTREANNLTTEEEIRKVETSLVRSVYLEGDSLWTIEERMEHYGVPGVSIAVIKDNTILWSKAYGIMDK